MTHRDIKPGNFVVGIEQNSKEIYLIDYGLAKHYIDPRTRNHIPYTSNLPLAGTVRYSSINTHMGFEQSRRDDLESLAYSLIYLAKGVLPWQGIVRETKKEKVIAIKDKKMETTIEELCSSLPIEFCHFLHYCKELNFEQKPNYSLLISFLTECFKRQGFKEVVKYDWELIKHDPNKLLQKPNNSNDSNQAEGITKDEAFARDKSPDATINRKRSLENQLQSRVGAIKFLIAGSTQLVTANVQKDSKRPAKLLEEDKNVNKRVTLRSVSQEIVDNRQKQIFNKKEDDGLCDFKLIDIIEDKSLLGRLLFYPDR